MCQKVAFVAGLLLHKQLGNVWCQPDRNGIGAEDPSQCSDCRAPLLGSKLFRSGFTPERSDSASYVVGVMFMEGALRYWTYNTVTCYRKPLQKYTC
jgi:hypothetical protein